MSLQGPVSCEGNLNRLHNLVRLDPRSLACLRIGTALVLAWDILRALHVADDWWGMQGYSEPKLPAWLVLGSEATTLRLAAMAVIAISILLALGWRTRPLTLLAWASACAFQYAARTTSDYHNAVLCTLLFYSLALPTAMVASRDARARRKSQWPAWLETLGSTGLLLSLAWIYLSTAAAKTGPAWWGEGSAVWLALLDRGTPTTVGRWLALSAPSWIWPLATWSVLLVEWLAPILLVMRRTRCSAVAGLVLFHMGMWPLLDLGSFPVTMIVALAALVPGSVWDQFGWPQPTAEVVTRSSPIAARVLAGFMALAVVITLEGERVVAWEGDTTWPYPGARHVARLRYLLGLEVVWGMYAPEPLRNAGWWVAVGWQADGKVVDPITGLPPGLDPPAPSGPGSNLRWLALSDAPDLVHGWGVQHIYRNFLLAQRLNSGSPELLRLALVWVHEPLTPFAAPTQRESLLILSWPEHAVSTSLLEQVLGTCLQAPVYNEESGALLGASGYLNPLAPECPH